MKTVKILVGWVALLFVLTIFDYRISESLFNIESIFGWFFEVFGEAVIAFVGCISGAILLRFGSNYNLIKKAGLVFLVFSFAVMGAILLAMQLNLHIIFAVLIFVLIAVSSIFVAKKVPEHNREVAKKVAVVGVIVSILPIFTINAMKVIWGRQRLRSMSNPILDFKPWYLISGPASGNEFMSFPSGHAANSATVIWFSLLPRLFDKSKKTENTIMVIAVVWTLCVMLSRIIVGAHFATDVYFGASITFAIFFYFKRRAKISIN